MDFDLYWLRKYGHLYDKAKVHDLILFKEAMRQCWDRAYEEGETVAYTEGWKEGYEAGLEAASKQHLS